jgi:hypothetical protein
MTKDALVQPSGASDGFGRSCATHGASFAEDQTTLEQVKEDSHPHACLRDAHGVGWVFIGFIAINDESGEEEETVVRFRCKRCEAETH